MDMEYIIHDTLPLKLIKGVKALEHTLNIMKKIDCLTGSYICSIYYQCGAWWTLTL